MLYNSSLYKKEKIIILGHSGSGKDYLMKKLIELGLKQCLKLTTRPMRINEEQGIEYNFITKEEFFSYLEKGDLLVSQKFTVTPLNSDPQEWWYGISKEDFNQSQVVIMTPGEYSQLDFNVVNRKYLFVVYLDIDRNIRESRLHNRKDNMDSIKRRLDADEIDFKDFNDYDLKVRDPDFTADDIYDLME